MIAEPELQAREEMIVLLNGIVAKMTDVSLAARTAHWNIRGSGFYALHELLERVHLELDQLTDRLAENIAALGGIAKGTAQVVATDSGLEPYPVHEIGQGAHIDALAVRMKQLGSGIRLALEACDRRGDPITAHHLTDAWACVDKLRWLVEAHIVRTH